MARVLPTRHFHCVFTVPAELRVLFRCNPVRLYNLLFDAAAQTLLDLGRDPEHLGAQLGFTAVLHTWDRQLNFHPHIHAVVSGGGLSLDQTTWVPSRRDDFLFPVAVVSALFRGKFLAGLRRLYDEGQLRFGAGVELAEPRHFQRLVNHLYQTDWLTYLKQPFGGAEHVYRYLSRYVSRIGISNHRIRSVDEHGVTFATKDGKAITLEPTEFIRRFLQHVPPRGFVRIRHYGLLAPGNVKTRLETARRLLAAPTTADATPSPTPAITSSSSAAGTTSTNTVTSPPVFSASAPMTSLSDGVLARAANATVVALGTPGVPLANVTAADRTATVAGPTPVVITASAASPPTTWDERLQKLTGSDPWLCPQCKRGRLMRQPLDAVPPVVAAPEARTPDTS